ncbi:hypothetical protein DERP_000604 [Dermatophagoides pteronyssinus]|uniref:Uncharacterized protein n=1 Tax=Dermatophagoides pteronyssinus TaxID=6956 RepID=A0ABQ8J0L2_DERPT|nr:hypothetical protein DERP_000604 [Dermatophagoides pteronyssinus]
MNIESKLLTIFLSILFSCITKSIDERNVSCKYLMPTNFINSSIHLDTRLFPRNINYFDYDYYDYDDQNQ